MSLKFKVDKAKNINPDTLVITRTDGQSVKDDSMYLVINLAKPHGYEVYNVLRKHGYDIPEVEQFLRNR